MTVKIEIHQSRTVVAGPLYRVFTEVVHSIGIDRKIFVFNKDTEEFSHVATTWDMESLPGSLAEAQASSEIEYYRDNHCTKDYEDATDAAAFAVYTRGRVEYLVNQYAEMQTDFIGEGDYEYVSE